MSAHLTGWEGDDGRRWWEMKENAGQSGGETTLPMKVGNEWLHPGPVWWGLWFIPGWHGQMKYIEAEKSSHSPHKPVSRDKMCQALSLMSWWSRGITGAPKAKWWQGHGMNALEQRKQVPRSSFSCAHDSDFIVLFFCFVLPFDCLSINFKILVSNSCIKISLTSVKLTHLWCTDWWLFIYVPTYLAAILIKTQNIPAA